MRNNLSKIIFLFIFLMAEIVPAQVHLSLTDTVYVHTLPVVVGDLIDENSKALLREDILNIPVVKSLNIGGQRLLTAEMLAAKLKRMPQLAIIDFEISPSRVLLVRPYRDMKFAEFKESVEQYVKSRFRENHFAVSIEIDSDERIIKVPEGDISSAFSHYSELKGGKNSIMMNLSNGFDFSVNVALSITIRTWDKVPVALKMLKPYSEISENDVKWEIRETTYIPDKHIIRPGELIENSKVLHLINSDQIISRDNIQSPPLIPRGTPVILYVVKGNIKIEAPGIALQNGDKDDTIWVKNDYTKKKMKARVVDKKRVMVTAF